jgi:hypothetical protein
VSACANSSSAAANTRKGHAAAVDDHGGVMLTAARLVGTRRMREVGVKVDRDKRAEWSRANSACAEKPCAEVKFVVVEQAAVAHVPGSGCEVGCE